MELLSTKEAVLGKIVLISYVVSVLERKDWNISTAVNPHCYKSLFTFIGHWIGVKTCHGKPCGRPLVSWLYAIISSMHITPSNFPLGFLLLQSYQRCASTITRKQINTQLLLTAQDYHKTPEDTCFTLFSF